MAAAVAVAIKKGLPVDWETLRAGIARGKTVVECRADHTIFMQGEPADSLFFLLRGRVKLAVASHGGKEAILATLGSGELFGEGCLAGQPSRMATATSVGDCSIAKVEKPIMVRMIHEEQGLAALPEACSRAKPQGQCYGCLGRGRSMLPPSDTVKPVT